MNVEFTKEQLKELLRCIPLSIPATPTSEYIYEKKVVCPANVTQRFVLNMDEELVSHQQGLGSINWEDYKGFFSLRAIRIVPSVDVHLSHS